MFESIKNDQGNHYDTIVDHGYTGKIDQEYIKEISGSILIGVITCSKLQVYLKALIKGMELYYLS